MGTLDTLICLIAFVLSIYPFNSLGEGHLTTNIEHGSSASLADGLVSMGTKWALLIAGSNGYSNYRHQASICHAYHILKDGGLNEENIIVFMFDDIAYNEQNPNKGVINNYPSGPNLYRGVPKDYTGEAVNSNNFLAALLGNKVAIKGGSRKVLETGPNDDIFIYYAGHGAAGLLSMPGGAGPLFAKDLIQALEKKHVSKSYKKMVIYIEASESGSIFDGRLLPTNWNIYAVTSSNPSESSYATYCSDDTRAHRYTKTRSTCFADVFSMSWMDDSYKSNPSKETLQQQYDSVRSRTASTTRERSHVMQYGDRTLANDLRSFFIGTNIIEGTYSRHLSENGSPSRSGIYSYAEVELMYLEWKVEKAPPGSNERAEAQRALDKELARRRHVVNSMHAIAVTLFGEARGPSMITMVRPEGQPVVDDGDCYEKLLDIYETHCGPMKTCGVKFARAFANFCNAGVTEDQMVQATVQACG